MIPQFFTVGLLMLFTTIVPGPDFALVTKNTLLYSRRAGLFTSLGIGCAALLHITYCSLGLAIIISNSIILFTLIKFAGSLYLIYMGITSVLIDAAARLSSSDDTQVVNVDLPKLTSFRQGLLCNLLNPKVTLFFLALFTLVITPETSSRWMVYYAIEMVMIVFIWFYSLTFILSHERIKRTLEKSEIYITKLLGVLFIIFGFSLVFFKNN